MKTRRLGRTNHESSVAILGGAAFWNATEDEALKGLELAFDRGVNHLDIAPRYGVAEERVGPHVGRFRDDIFLACKTGRKNAAGVRAQVEDSLRRLRTDRFDLYQLHAVTSLAVLEERTGAVEAILEAKERDLTRFVGITGHDLGAPEAHLEALRRWDLDTVMFAVNPQLWTIENYRRDAEALLSECARRDVGVMAIKAVARRPWGEVVPTRTTWYEPLTDPAAIRRAVRATLHTEGVHALCTPSDLDLLPDVLDAAENFESTVDGPVDAELIFPLAERGRFDHLDP